ncbi:MAG: hypothetical protein AAFR35_14130 [Pseudomonadota bacterium]
MKRLIVSALAATAIALSPLATGTAHAQDNRDEIVGILAGLAALAVVGKIISDANDDDDKKSSSSNRAVVNRSGNFSHGHHHDQRFVNRVPLPNDCLRRYRVGNGERRTLYGARCLRNNTRRPALLPDRCLREVRTDRGFRLAYGPRCLRRAGFQLEARNR